MASLIVNVMRTLHSAPFPRGTARVILGNHNFRPASGTAQISIRLALIMESRSLTILQHICFFPRSALHKRSSNFIHIGACGMCEMRAGRALLLIYGEIPCAPHQHFYTKSTSHRAQKEVTFHLLSRIKARWQSRTSSSPSTTAR